MAAQIEKVEQKIEELERIAEEKLSGEYTSEIHLWLDGDFKVKVYHGFTDDKGKNKREVLSYKHSSGQIIYTLDVKADWTREEAELIEGEWHCIECGEEGNILDIHGVKCRKCYNEVRTRD